MVTVSQLDKNAQRIIANALFIEIKEGRWRKHKATRTVTLATGGADFLVIGAHSDPDTDEVRQRRKEVFSEHSYLQTISPPYDRFSCPPYGMELLKNVYTAAMKDLEGDYLWHSWHNLLASRVLQPFLPDTNRHGSARMRRNTLTEGMSEQAAEACIALTRYCTIKEIDRTVYDCHLNELSRTNYDELAAIYARALGCV